MNIKIVGRKVNLRENFKELVQRKLSKFDRIFDEDADATVTVTLEKNRQTVEIMIKQRGMLYLSLIHIWSESRKRYELRLLSGKI